MALGDGPTMKLGSMLRNCGRVGFGWVSETYDGFQHGGLTSFFFRGGGYLKRMMGPSMMVVFAPFSGPRGG